MADQFVTSLPLHQPLVSPYGSSSHQSRGIGHGVWSRRHSIGVTAPLLFVGVCAAIVLAFSPATYTGDAASHSPVTLMQEDPNQSDAHTQSTGSSSQIVVNGQQVLPPENSTVTRSVLNPDGSVTTYTISNATNSSGETVISVTD